MKRFVLCLLQGAPRVPLTPVRGFLERRSDGEATTTAAASAMSKVDELAAAAPRRKAWPTGKAAAVCGPFALQRPLHAWCAHSADLFKKVLPHLSHTCMRGGEDLGPKAAPSRRRTRPNGKVPCMTS